MIERDSFRLWTWAQDKRDEVVWWGCVVLAVIAYVFT